MLLVGGCWLASAEVKGYASVADCIIQYKFIEDSSLVSIKSTIFPCM